MTNGRIAIHAQHLVKTYPGGVRALNGLSFEASEGTVFGLLGPNGAGKSTAIRVLTTLAQLDSGEARVVGLDVMRRPADVRRSIGVVAQRSGADPDATGRENLTLQARVHGLSAATARDRVVELLDRFGLTPAADRYVRTYSGGMRRKLDVALGLVHRPRVLFLDEPTTGLDPDSRAQMWREIDALTGDGTTVLLTTHYLEEADRLAHRVAIVDRGRVVVSGTPHELKATLKGDAVRLELTQPADEATVQLLERDVPGLAAVVRHANELHVRSEDGAASLPTLIGVLERHGIAVAGATVTRPSLDDVFLQYTGRPIDDRTAPTRSLDA